MKVIYEDKYLRPGVKETYSSLEEFGLHYQLDGFIDFDEVKVLKKSTKLFGAGMVLEIKPPMYSNEVPSWFMNKFTYDMELD